MNNPASKEPRQFRRGNPERAKFIIRVKAELQKSHVNLDVGTGRVRPPA